MSSSPAAGEVVVLHTSDWHVGATLGAIDRRPDHEVALTALVELARASTPDLIVHTGDLFDRALPAGDDLRFAARHLAALADVAPVLVLCGNHDGRATFAGLDAFCAIGAYGDSSARIHLVSSVAPGAMVLTYPTRAGARLRVVPIPFLPLAVAGFEAVAAGATASGAYADRVRAIWTIAAEELAAGRGGTDVDMAAAHLHLSGAVLARSEKTVHVGDDAATDAAALPPVAYAAFGHIHRPQAIPGPTTGRYAGSVIPLDFGEAGESKGAVVVRARPGRAAVVEPRVLASGRPLHRVEGSVNDGSLDAALTALPDSGAIVSVRVLDHERIEGLGDVVRSLLPPRAALYSAVQPAVTARRGSTTGAAHDEDTASLLAGFAHSKGWSHADVTALVELWQRSRDHRDLTGGALQIVADALAAAGADAEAGT